jgi:type I restriction enzyme S subunit
MIEEVNLADVCDIIAGQSPPSSTYNQEGNGVPFFQGKADFGEIYPTVRYWCNSPKKMSKPDDILFSVRAPVGPTNINNITACIGRGLAAIRCNNIERNYLLHYLRGNEEKIASLGSGSTFKAITIGTLKEIKIPLPPLDQQKKIAVILDAADAYRQKTKALIEKYDELTQSLFLDMFGDPVTNPKGWEIQCLSNVCTLQGGFSFKSKDFVENGVKLVKIGNVHFQNIIWDEVDLLPKEFLVKHSNFSLNEGDILMALTRPIIKSLGTVKAVTVKKSDLPCLLNQRVARFVPNESKIKKRYLLDYIYSNYFKNKIDKYSSTSLQPNVSNKQIEKIEIFVPPLEIQNQFTKRVQAIEAQKVQAQASLSQAEDLFNSLLQRAFKGELTS